MTTLRIVYRRLGGGVSIVNPAPNRIAQLIAGGMTEDEAIVVIQAKAVPVDATNVEIMEQSLIPASREFRNAWEKLGGGPPTVNMAKAREIHAAHITAAQTGETLRLKREETQARMRGRMVDADKAAADRAAVEALNVTAIGNQITSAATPEALSAIWPPELAEQRRNP